MRHFDTNSTLTYKETNDVGNRPAAKVVNGLSPSDNVVNAGRVRRVVLLKLVRLLLPRYLRSGGKETVQQAAVTPSYTNRCIAARATVSVG